MKLGNDLHIFVQIPFRWQSLSMCCDLIEIPAFELIDYLYMATTQCDLEVEKSFLTIFRRERIWGEYLKGRHYYLAPSFFSDWQGDNKQILAGREPWSSGYGMRLAIWRLRVRIPVPFTGWTFFHINLLQTCIDVWLKKTENKQKDAGDGPF